MEKKLEKARSRKNVIKLLQYREGNAEGAKYVKRHCQFTDDLIKRFGLEDELQGHQGCVNCLQWTSDGRVLASGSDDTNVILWDPFRHKQLQVVSTNHIGNIFSVKFLGTNNSIIATAAGDCRVLVQSIPDTPILDCNCHKNRVKRLATSPIEPTLFWSAGEDGLVMQYDLREQHECSSNKANLLISYRIPYEVKCVAVNPTKPHYIAVGANDVYVRLYDRRMIKTCPITQMNDNEFVYPPKQRLIDKNCVQYYAPGHLAIENSNVANFRFAATYVSFNAAGSEMLVNMGGEQIYLFDVNYDRPVNEIRMPNVAERKPFNKYKCKCSPEGNGYIKYTTHIPKMEPSDDKCPCFFMRRAYMFFRRRWMGDLYSAARDYLYVTQNWPDQIKAHIGLIKCLIALKWAEEAQKWYDYLCDMNGDFSLTNQARLMRDGIQSAKTSPKENVGDSERKDVFLRIEEDEIKKRLESKDYEVRFLGHCNTTTDIKEANFLGEDGNYVCAGSDEGIIFIWERKKSSIVTALWGDVSIVNCVQPHPSACFVASSGIDPVVKLWSPMPENIVNSRIVNDVNSVIETNQQRMAMDPFESLLVNMGYHIQDRFLPPHGLCVELYRAMKIMYQAKKIKRISVWRLGVSPSAISIFDCIVSAVENIMLVPAYSEIMKSPLTSTIRWFKPVWGDRGWRVYAEYPKLNYW